VAIKKALEMAANGIPNWARQFVRFLFAGVMAVSLLWIAISCGPTTDSKTSATNPPNRSLIPKKPAPETTGPKTPDDGLTAELSKIINDASLNYKSLEYQYDEGLLNILDRSEAHLAGKSKGPAPRAMPKLSEQEEYDHLRETIRRWHAKTGKDLRAEIDKLKAQVAERKPGGPVYHPDFHKKFASVFDDFIPIEVGEIRERRNRVIHEKAKPILDKYRETAPASVKQYETILNAPPYKLSESSAAPTEAPPHAAPAERKGK
jgi:hypothetical protein